MPIQSPPTHGDSNDDQWDVVTTIGELEKLQAQTQRVIEHTVEKMGIHHGHMPDGTEIIEHPLGVCISALNEALRACQAKYGRDMLEDARMMDGSLIVRGQEKRNR